MTDDVKIEVVPSNESPTMWKSCCGLELDKNAVVYFTQIGIICGIMSFAIYKLSTDKSCEVQTTYLALLSSLTGYILPSPIFKSK